MNIFAEELDQLVFLLLLVLDEPGGGPLPEELHEPPLHHDPEHPGQVEDHSHEYEVERHPLVVRVVHDGGGLHVLVQ